MVYICIHIHKKNENTNADADSSIFTISTIWKKLKLLNPSNKEMGKEIRYVPVCVYACLLLSVSVLSTLCNPMGCDPPDSSVHGILQASILEWVAISFSRGSSWSRNWTHVSCGFWIARKFFTTEPPGKPMCVYMCAYVYKHIHVIHMYVHKHTYIHTYIICTYIYIHTHAYWITPHS